MTPYGAHPSWTGLRVARNDRDIHGCRLVAADGRQFAQTHELGPGQPGGAGWAQLQTACKCGPGERCSGALCRSWR